MVKKLHIFAKEQGIDILETMTQVILNIKNKSDLPFLRKLSKRMGWTISGNEKPNSETIAAMLEAESDAELEDFDLDSFHKMVESL